MSSTAVDSVMVRSTSPTRRWTLNPDGHKTTRQVGGRQRWAQWNRSKIMKEFNDAAVGFAITGEPTTALSSGKILRARGGRKKDLGQGRPKFCASSFAMVPNGYDAIAYTVPGPLNCQNISDNSYKIATSATSDALSTQDIVNGAIIAFILAFGCSFLNGQSSSSSFVSWPSRLKKQNDSNDTDTSSVEGIDGKGNGRNFNADDWKEMSREENYILFRTKIRQRSNVDTNTPIRKVDTEENKLVLVALLALFVPIFFVEFFFALSRQFMCEMRLGGDIVQRLCSPSG
jgi:hypothetical protein